VPQSFRVLLDTPAGPREIECREEEYVLDAAARGGVPLPFICHQGRCLTRAARLLEGEVDRSDADTYFPQDRAAGFILPCRARPLSELRILTHQCAEIRRHRIALGLPAPYA
jgi:ferredoxin